MRAAHRPDEPVPRRRPGADRLRLPDPAGGKAKPFGAAAGQSAVERSRRGHREKARDRPSVRNHREVDGVFARSGDVFLGAVERIDQHEGIARERREARHLLGDHVDPRHQPGHRLDQQGLRALVGGGHRRGVGLGADVDRIAPDREDRLSGIGDRHG